MDFLELSGVSIPLAFAAGLLSCLSPCVLPLIPAYLGYLTGASLESPRVPVQAAVVAQPGGSGSAGVMTATAPGAAIPSPFLHAVSFVSGFSLVFVLFFGVSAGLLGYLLQDHQDVILKVSGTLLIIMGLHLSRVITIPFLEQERRLDAGSGGSVGYARSFVVGSTFSAGWSPCIGPTLGAILALSVSGGGILQAIILLLIYSAGLSVPFLAMGLAYNSVKPVYNRFKPYLGVVNYLSGAMLIIVGILIFTDSLINFNNLFNFGVLRDVSSGA